MPGITFLYKEAVPNQTLVSALRRLFAGGAIKRTGRPLRTLTPGPNAPRMGRVRPGAPPPAAAPSHAPAATPMPSRSGVDAWASAVKPQNHGANAWTSATGAGAKAMPKPGILQRLIESVQASPRARSVSDWANNNKLLSSSLIAGGVAAPVLGTAAAMQSGAAPTVAPTASGPAPTPPPTATAPNSPASPGWLGTAMKYAPLAALGGLGAYGLYQAYDDLTGKDEQGVDFVPKTANAAEFSERFPFVAGFLAKCASDGCDMNDILVRIKAAAAVAPELQVEFAAAFEKSAILEAQFNPAPAGAAPKPPVTAQPQAPLGQAAAQQALKPQAPAVPPAAPAKPEMPQLPPGDPNWVDEQGNIHAEPKPTGPHQPVPINMQVDHNSGPSGISNYWSQLNAFYNPWSKEYANVSSNDAVGTGLRATGRIAGGVGLAAGAAAGGLAAAGAAAPGLAALGGKALGTAGAVGNTLGKGYLGLEAMQAAGNVSQLKNPLTNTLGNQLMDAAIDGNPYDSRISQLTNGPWAPADAEKNRSDLFGLIKDRAASQGKVLTDSEVLAEVDRISHNKSIVPGQNPDPFAAANEVQDLSPTPQNERQQALDAAFQEYAKQHNLSSEQVQKLQQTMVGVQNVDQPTVDKARESLLAQVAQTNPEVAKDPNMLEQLLSTFEALPPGAKALLAGGLSIGLIGMLSMVMDPDAGIGSTLMTLAGLGTAGLTAAHNGMLGDTAKNFVQPVTGGITDLYSTLMGGGATKPDAAKSPAAAGAAVPLPPAIEAELSDPNSKLNAKLNAGLAGGTARMGGIMDSVSGFFGGQGTMVRDGIAEQLQAKMGMTPEAAQAVADEVLRRRASQQTPPTNQSAQLDQYQQSRFGGGNPNIPQAA